MRNLTFHPRLPDLRRLRREDRGGIGVLVAVLMAGGVLLGMGAMTVDVGQLYQNRAELQNGADSAALAIAQSCADGSCDTGLATHYADANASALTGGTAGVGTVCGTGSGMTKCNGTGKITECPIAPASANYVDVHTYTTTASGSTVLPPVFAGTLLGKSYKGTQVQACAQAEWGAPATATVSALSINDCAWNWDTSSGSDYAVAPPNWPDSSWDMELAVSGSSNDDNCDDFAWVGDTGNCSASVTGTSYSGNEYDYPDSSCATALYNAWNTGDPIYVPVFNTIQTTADSANPEGFDTTMSLQGFAAFVVTGYNLKGYSNYDWLNSSDDPGCGCGGCSYYIDGYFTTGLIPSTGKLGGNYMGADISTLTG